MSQNTQQCAPSNVTQPQVLDVSSHGPRTHTLSRGRQDGADTLGHTSAAVSWQSQRSWEKELAQTSRQCRSQGIHSLVRLLRVGREAHTLLSPDSLSPVSREPSAP